MDPFETAVQLVLDPTTDAAMRAQAHVYVEQIKADPDGWLKLAMRWLHGAYQHETTRFVCLQVIEETLRTRYATLSQEHQNCVRNIFLEWLRLQAAAPEPSIRNKVAQCLALVFIEQFPKQWPSFFTDIIALFEHGKNVMDMFLRVLTAIDEIVVDRDFTRTAEEQERNTWIKDTMRELAVPDIVTACMGILTACSDTEPQLASECLCVLSAYIDWIDINLIVNDTLLQALYHSLHNATLREAACDVFVALVLKGMDPQSKLSLIESLRVIEILQSAAGLCVEDELNEFAAKLAKLTNTVGSVLIEIIHKTQDEHTAVQARRLLHLVLPLLFTFLEDEDDGVSETVIDLCVVYVQFVRGQMHAAERQNVRFLLEACVKKMKFDEEHNFEREDETESLFYSFRKELKKLFDNIAILDEGIVLEYALQEIPALLDPTTVQSLGWNDIELALFVVYIMGEAVKSHGPHFNTDVASPLTPLLDAVMLSGVDQCPHQAVVLQLCNNIGRYSLYFALNQQHIPTALNFFLSDHAIFSTIPLVRSRCSYVITKFCRALRSPLQPLIANIFERLAPALALNPNLSFFSFDDQLYIYEAVSLLVFSSQSPKDIILPLVQPLIDRFNSLLSELPTIRDVKTQMRITDFLLHIIAIATRISKGVCSTSHLEQSGMFPIFQSLLDCFINALRINSNLRSGVRMYLHRMVAIMGVKVLPSLPIAIRVLLESSCEASDLSAFLPLVVQLMTKFKGAMLEFLDELFYPFAHAIFSHLQEPVEDNDLCAISERKELQKSYYSLVLSVLTNLLSGIFTSDRNRVHLIEILGTVLQGICSGDSQIQRCCVQIFKLLCREWEGEQVEGFNDYLLADVLPATLQMMFAPEFDLSESQASFAVLEVAALHKEMCKYRPEQTMQLEQSVLHSLGVPGAVIAEYCQLLQTEENTKTISTMLKRIVKERKQ
eukprot:m.45804 g.45804  ORF g.45804 m.45804 type:complete len:947 (-) comp6265_c0_seq1:239-3079(-)